MILEFVKNNIAFSTLLVETDSYICGHLALGLMHNLDVPFQSFMELCVLPSHVDSILKFLTDSEQYVINHNSTQLLNLPTISFGYMEWFYLTCQHRTKNITIYVAPTDLSALTVILYSYSTLFMNAINLS